MKELDAVRRKQFFEDISKRSLASRQRPHSTHSYNCSHKTDENKFEFYNSTIESNKTVIFIHGGAWVNLTLEVSAYLTEYFVNSGYNFAPIGFNPGTHAGMTNMLLETQSAIKEILRIYPQQTEIFVMGHSAGAHMGLLSYLYDYFPSDLQFTVEDRSRIRGLILMSGTYDLRFLCNEPSFSHLKLSLEEAWKLSPLRCICEINKYNSDLRVFLISEDDPDFHFLKHSEELLENLKKCLKAKNITFLALKNMDHFDVADKIGDSNFEVTNQLRRFLGVDGLC